MVALRAGYALAVLAAMPLLAAKAQSPAAEPPFVVRTELSRHDPWERSQVLYTVRIFRASGSRQYGRIRRLHDPILLQGEALMEQLGTDREYNFRSEDAESLVLERRYALYPQSVGEILLQPASLQWIGEEFGFRTRSFIPDAEPQRLEVRPVPAPPPGRWLAARDVRLWEEFEREPIGLVAGEPMIRLIGVQVEGQPARQIPRIDPGDGPNFRHFSERADYEETVTAAGLVGVRRQRVALLALRGGEVILPAIRLNWWNTADERWETAELPQRILQAQASFEQGAAQPLAAPVQAVPLNDWLVPLLAGGWLFTGLAWWISSRIIANRRLRGSLLSRLSRDSGGRLARVREHLGSLAAACRSDDAAAAEKALLAWARAYWGSGAPRNLRQLGDRFGEPAATECRRLDAALYAPAAGSWNPAVLLQAARRPPPVRTPGRPGHSGLPELWPRKPGESG